MITFNFFLPLINLINVVLQVLKSDHVIVKVSAIFSAIFSFMEFTKIGPIFGTMRPKFTLRKKFNKYGVLNIFHHLFPFFIWLQNSGPKCVHITKLV